MSDRFDKRGIPYNDEDRYWYIYGMNYDTGEEYLISRICCCDCGTELHRDNIMRAEIEKTKPLDPWEDPDDLPFARIAEIAGIDELVCISCFLEAK
jgi:hypothetical protein